MSSNEFNKLDRDYTEREDYLASRAEERGAFRSGMTLAEIAEDIAKTRRAIDYIKSVRKPIQAHSKTEYKRLVTQGANVLPPADSQEGMKMDKKTAGQIHFEHENIGYGLFWSEQDESEKYRHERLAAAVIAHARPQIEQEVEEVKLRIGEDV